MIAHTLFLAASVFSIVHGQVIDPTTVPIAIRDGWCNQQKASCPLLCTQIGGPNVPLDNNCEPTSLAYSCVCSNGLQPNASQYSQTIPYFECTESATQCVNACAQGDNSCVSNCRTTHLCGAQNPTKVNVTSTTSTASATAATSTGDSSATAATGFGGPNSSAANSLGASQLLATVTFVTCLLAVSAILL